MLSDSPSRLIRMFSLHDLGHQQVRDLGFSCFGEPLITAFDQITGADAPAHCSLRLTAKRIAWLQQLDRRPDLLMNHIDRVRPRKLGHYHEALWHFFLQQDDQVELLATNLQVNLAGRTIGEFDVIYHDLKARRHVHLELAFKVYLQAPDHEASGLAQWLGPNVIDRLDRKLGHMLNHQCRLSGLDAGRQLLDSMGISEVAAEISLRGYLLRSGLLAQEGDLPGPLNPDLRFGRWLPVSRVIPLLDQAECWVPLSRLNWVSRLDPVLDDGYEPAGFANYLRQHFERSDAALMVCALDNHGDGPAVERFRLMVAADCWPNCRG